VDINKAQRLTLVNQYRILALLEPTEAETHSYMASLFEMGLEEELAEWGWLDDQIDHRIAREVIDILTMFEALELSATKIEDLSGDTLRWLRFRGFDHNQDFDHLRYYEASVARPGHWNHFKDRQDLNGHSEVLPMYRRMLEEFQPIWRKKLNAMGYDLTKEELVTVAAAAIHPDYR
jgi:uncharacterized protein YfbU (UPF0304 family)